MTKKRLNKHFALATCNLRRIVLCCALLFTTLSASAQWSVGTTMGYSHNTLSINTGYAYDFRYHSAGGFTMAIPVKYQFNDWFALRPELNIIQKGYRMERTGKFAGIYNEASNNYLQLPVMANFSFGGERLRGFFNAGGYIGGWITSRMNGVNMVMPGIPHSYDSFEEDNMFDSRRDNRFEAGLLAGAGISYKVSKMVALELEARYYYSLTDMQKQYMKFLTPRYNNTLAVQIGCMVTFGNEKEK